MQIEKTIEETDGLFKALFDITNQGVIFHDNGVVYDCNSALEKMLGYEHGELIGANIIDINVLSEYRDFVRTNISNGLEVSYEVKGKKKSGDVFTARVLSSIDICYKGHNMRLAIVIDLTEQKIADKNLQRSEAFLNTIVENIPDMIFVKSVDDFQFVLFNKAGEELLGYRKEEVIGKTDFDIFPEKEAEFFRKKDREVLEKNKLVRIPEETIQTSDSGKRVLSSKKLPIMNRDGKPNYILGIAQDVTCLKKSEKERIKLEHQLQQAQKMESIGTLAGGIAHDFNNILLPILGHAEMILEDIPKDSPIRDGLNQIYTGALRAKSLIKQILTFSHQESNEIILMKMQPIIKEALKLIRSTIPTTIEIKQDINPDCGVIKADPTQIHQIVMNLTTNAYHAMEDSGGELKVSLKEMEFGTLDLTNPDMTPGVYACLTITDTGVGMDKDLTDKIFDPFFTTKAIGKGTGMGLSVVHGIVTAMGGVIHVYSEQGKGTQFHVYLPVEKSLPEEQVTHSKIEIQGGSEHILLVDDEEMILTMEKRRLERLGYQVTSRFSSLDALEAFRINPDRFDLVITDMAMPNMPGDKLSAELIKIRYDIPILLCTGFSEPMSEEKAASLGIKGFILKPIVMKDLAQKIREILDKN